MSDEIGRELKPSELKAGTIVVIAPPGHDHVFLTMHVVEARDNLVVFYSGVMKWHIINLVSGDELKDDQGRVVRVFEYLGEP